jgi:hypothetical protein
MFCCGFLILNFSKEKQMNTNDTKAMDRVFQAASLDELLQMHSQLVSIINHRRRERSARAVLGFRPGQKVSFTGRSGVKRVGVVQRVNQTTVSVLCEPMFKGGPSEPWRVGANLLKAI